MTAELGNSDIRPSLLNLVGPSDEQEQNKLFLRATRHSDAAKADDRSLDAKSDIVDSFLRLAALPTFPLDRLSRYEHTLWLQARQLVFTLESLRRRKQQPSRPRFPFSFPCGYPKKLK